MNAPHAYFKALCGTFNILLIYRYRPNKNNGLNRLKMARFKKERVSITLTLSTTNKNQNKEPIFLSFGCLSNIHRSSRHSKNPPRSPLKRGQVLYLCKTSLIGQHRSKYQSRYHRFGAS